MTVKKRIGEILLYVVMAIISIVFLFPLAWTLVCSFKPEASIVSYPPVWLPVPFTFDNYIQVLLKYPFLSWMANSIIVAIISTIFVLLLTSMAAYAFARIDFKGKNILFACIVAMLLIPIQAYIVPLFLLSSALGLLNTFLSLVLVAGANVTGVFILTSFFKTIPKELEEAAWMDGCKDFSVFFRIILPLSKTALSSVAILTFISNWNSFLWPMIVMRQDELKTLPVGIAQFMGGAGSTAQFQYGTSLASATMAIIPSVIVFLLLQRHFVQGIASTGIKG